ncbi:MAG: glycine zipper 2TM domain-containing protein [Sulfuritalea sp.]|nr:glycine zipper 2TM domain-containing protein [Sulfuritalea sp.]
MKKCLALMVATTFLAGSAIASDAVSKTGSEAAKKAAATRYAEDKKLCAEESSSSTRMQCLRDAKAEYDAALAKAGKDQTRGATGSDKACTGCGKVLSVKVVEKEGESSPVGVVAGGVAGALLGNQIGSGTGRSVATVAGAAGGAYAGHKIEQKIKSVKKWQVAVHFDNGEEKTFSFDKDPGLTAGTAVKASNGSIVRR